MQMTMDQAMRPARAHAFALRKGSGYVMRSEKRPAYGSGGAPRRGGRKPKPPKAGILYILLTILISIIIWPVGLVMLWSRRVRMQAGTKLLISLLTLCVSVFLIVFTLTVHVDNPKFTEFQDKANDWLNHAAADIAVAGDAAYKKGSETWVVMTEFANNTIEPAANTLADGLDRGVALAGDARVKIEGLFRRNSVDAPVPTIAPAESAEPAETPLIPEATETAAGTVEVSIPENTPDPETAQALTGGVLKNDGTLAEGETPEPTATPEASEAPEATVQANADVSALPDANAATPEPEPTGTPEPEPTETPEPEPTDDGRPHVKPAGKATVYYNKVGKLYHMRSTCKSMTRSTAYTLAEAIADGKRQCNACGSPDPDVLNIEHVAWVDSKKTFHTTDECPEFKGSWKLVSLKDALAVQYAACPACRADLYAAEFGEGAEVVVNAAETPEPTEAPTEAPTAEPTAAPTEAPTAAPTQVPAEAATAQPVEAPVEEAGVTALAAPVQANAAAEKSIEAAPTATPEPAVPLKDPGEVIVYHSSNGKFYHRFSVCKAMSGSHPYKLSEITEKYKRCKTCDAPDTAMVGQPCVYMDENALCHTTDECEKFQGDYTLVLLDDAVAQGRAGCPDCGGDLYLPAQAK